jgi:type II secretory pathway component PulJ
MRKGFSIIQLLVIIFVLSLLLTSLAPLSTAMLRDIPSSYRLIEANTSMLSALKQMRRDVNAAKGFAKSFDDYIANNETLLIETANNVICYQFKNGELLRRKFANTETGTGEEIKRWSLRHGKIEWRLWQEDGRDYAVEINSCVEREVDSWKDRKMSNSYVYFTGIYLESVN